MAAAGSARTARRLTAASRLEQAHPGHSPCETRSGALVYESAASVIVGAWTYDPHPDAPCAASLEVESLPVRLARPLGHRVVLSVSDGRPLAAGSF